MNVDVNKIKIAQANECLSVNELVEKTGLGRATVSKIINGGCTTPSLKSIGLIAKALNVDVKDILLDEE
ncbi:MULTISPECIES: helix-turn-helix transcriptional regulator [unclassified Clostridium]|uniref:helix-turn-helix transcriptional regulator n=1 Tax=unclassified Clostridium TaxID=2614128 RepID=UPI00029825EA|nr:MULTISPECIES: helix-turn-helix transcriptional regulator [unclassified Clostridium]EKQ56204.1 MAG: putative transcriptional regulator [Clostridium sp. Maddingley MBC34-26]